MLLIELLFRKKECLGTRAGVACKALVRIILTRNENHFTTELYIRDYPITTLLIGQWGNLFSLKKATLNAKCHIVL